MLSTLIIIIISIGIVLFSILYLFQEKLIFIPEKLEKTHQFNFDRPFEEVFIKVDENVNLNALHFKTKHPKGVVFYLHGNAGSLSGWGDVANLYLDNQYDVFIIDYRGYGKSDATITNENQIHNDVQLAYNYVLNLYDENNIVVLGYSLGSGLAAKLAANNHPKQLILQAAYFSFTDLINIIYPIVPSFLLKYKLETNTYIPQCSMPITFIHGKNDDLIPSHSSERLMGLAKPSDQLFLLENQGHNGITDNEDYKKIITDLLAF